jgi:hypothetical protein
MHDRLEEEGRETDLLLLCGLTDYRRDKGGFAPTCPTDRPPGWLVGPVVPKCLLPHYLRTHTVHTRRAYMNVGDEEAKEVLLPPQPGLTDRQITNARQ